VVLKWFLSTLKQQYATRSEQSGNEKKPLNPFLGELFLGRWEHPTAGTTELVSEQVSHHPPVTAYSIFNDKYGVRLEGYNAQKASFSRTINVKQIGHAILTLSGFNDETYVITIPPLHIEGLIYGSPYVELNSCTYITSSTGYTSKIDYAGKGWVSGKKNSFTATLYPTGKEKDVKYNVEGQWTDTFSVYAGSKTKGEPVETFSAKSHPTTPLTIAPLEAQDPLESRKAWKVVAEAIQKGDMDTTGIDKTRIENEQRALRLKEKEEGREWERRYFDRVEAKSEKLLSDLISKCPGEKVEEDKTGGVWKFSRTKWDKLHRVESNAELK
jgi:oxysterol-binding protein-related protein 9/10/11